MKPQVDEAIKQYSRDKVAEITPVATVKPQLKAADFEDVEYRVTHYSERIPSLQTILKDVTTMVDSNAYNFSF